MKSGFGLTGNVLIEMHSADTGELLSSQRVNNRVTATGRDIVRDLLADSDHPPNFMAIGTGGTAVNDADVMLESEIFRNAFTRTVISASKVMYTVYVLNTQANGYTWRELGLFRGAKRYYTVEPGGTPLYGGTLFARAAIASIQKTEEITATITWEIPIMSV